MEDDALYIQDPDGNGVDPTLSLLMHVIRSSQPEMCILNFRRYLELLRAKKALDALLTQCDEQPSSLLFRPTSCCACLSAEIESLEVSNRALFHTILDASDNFEVYPLLNGKLRISFAFYHMMLPL